VVLPPLNRRLTGTNYRNLVEIIWSLLASNGGKCARYGGCDAQLWRLLGLLPASGYRGNFL